MAGHRSVPFISRLSGELGGILPEGQPVLLRRHAAFGMEKAREVRRVLESEIEGDGTDRKRGVDEAALGFPDEAVVDEADRGSARHSQAARAQVPRRHVEGPAIVRQAPAIAAVSLGQSEERGDELRRPARMIDAGLRPLRERPIEESQCFAEEGLNAALHGALRGRRRELQLSNDR
jgi:hypothetical protein